MIQETINAPLLNLIYSLYAYYSEAYLCHPFPQNHSFQIHIKVRFGAAWYQKEEKTEWK